ncbi:MAG: LysR family transcriptional regulator [Burkholderiales bacterium]|nr:LysR family transcriptional regulator [Burkholderiales bacterium]
MNLGGREIDAFLALAETKRFAIAAKRCHVSASAFSQIISRLEEQVGARLFDRNTRHVSLTPEGEAFSHGAYRIATELRATINELRERASWRTGRVTVAATPSLATDWVPRRLAIYRKSFPSIALRLHDVTSERCLVMIDRGEVDFGFNAQRGTDLEFESHLLFMERYYVLCRKTDPLARLKEIRLKDLKDREIVKLPLTGSVYPQMLPLLSSAQVRDSGMEVANFGTLAGLVAAGFGLGIVPEHALELCRRPGIVGVPINANRATRPVYMIRRRGRSLSAAAQAMWEQIAKDF